MTVVGIFVLHLAGPSRQQVLEGPETMLDPVAPLPRSYKPRPTDGRCETYHVKLLLPGLLNYDEGHGAIRWARSPQPRIAHPRHLLALPPRPLAVLLHVVALDLAPIGQCEGVGTLPFYEERPL